MWILAGKCRASYLVRLFKANQGQKRKHGLFEMAKAKLSGGAHGFQYSRYKIPAEENVHHKEICVLHKKANYERFCLCFTLGQRGVFDL